MLCSMLFYDLIILMELYVIMGDILYSYSYCIWYDYVVGLFCDEMIGWCSMSDERIVDMLCLVIN